MFLEGADQLGFLFGTSPGGCPAARGTVRHRRLSSPHARIRRASILHGTTGLPYATNVDPRMLAEFQADGPSSKTSTAHQIAILNYLSDLPMFEKRFHRTGRTMYDFLINWKFCLTGDVLAEVLTH